MSYLVRLKQLDVEKKSQHTPETVLTKPPKAPFVSYGSTVQGPYENISANDPAATSWRWVLHYQDRDPVELHTTPESTLAEVLRDFPDAIAAIPIAAEV